MPTISRFFGIVITMNYSDHAPPHFHVRYGEHRALVKIDGLLVLRGQLPPRVLGLVVEWASQHVLELHRNWELARDQQPLEVIAPLE
ncbi:MAG: DUF4160 domain-containing protein [Acidobacteria bacterium]|nr:DUF4160 domain-containing protein [Acidobacteriota bacterium]